MASSISLQNSRFSSIGLCLLFLSVFSSSLCKAQNVTSIVNASIQCFNNPSVFIKCWARFQSTNNFLDAFCSSPCLDESKLLLSCINGILSNFNFYSSATVQAINATILTFCPARSGANTTSPAISQSSIPPRLAPSASSSPVKGPSPSQAPSPITTSSPAPTPKPATSNGGSSLKARVFVPGLWAVGSLMFMVLP